MAVAPELTEVARKQKRKDRHNSQRNNGKRAQDASRQPTKTKRKPAFDVLRGVAILLMVIDHVAHACDFLIEPNNIRILTRLSMPLFALLMGYFLVKSRSTNFLRLAQLGIAAVIMSWLTVRAFGQAEILASLFCCAIVYRLTRPIFPIFAASAFLFAVDPTNAGSGLTWLPITFDYPLTICLSCVALGSIVARFHFTISIAAAVLVVSSGWLVPPPSAYVLIASLPATVLLLLASKYSSAAMWKTKPATWLGYCGLYPLSIYVAHYTAVILAMQMMPAK